jgi:hypothetical protein
MAGESKLTVEEGYQLIPCPLSAQCKSYRVEAMNRVQSQNHIIVLQLVDEDGDRVELVVLCVHGGLWGSGCGEACSRLGAVQGDCRRNGARNEVKEVHCRFVLARCKLAMGRVGAVQARSRVDVPVGRQENREY